MRSFRCKTGALNRNGASAYGYTQPCKREYLEGYERRAMIHFVETT